MWWLDVLIVALMVLGVIGFVTLVRDRTHRLSSHTDRRAEDMYGLYDDRRRR